MAHWAHAVLWWWGRGGSFGRSNSVACWCRAPLPPNQSEVAIVLPASKTDTQAHGVRRALKCSCDAQGAASAASHPL
eukprot:9155567-Lingulodinium_polyedra.AAC.1